MTNDELENIWSEVPPDYYQKGIKNNILQKLWHGGKLKTVKNLISNAPKEILDIGSASGWFLQQLHFKYPKAKCIGIDSYKDVIVYGKRKYKNLQLLKADAHSSPFKKNSFDLVICLEVLEHVKDPAKVLIEIKRVLKNDGIAIIEMDTGNLLFKIVWFFWTHVRNGVWKHAHIQEFHTNKLESMIKKSGFFIERKQIFNLSMAVAFKCRKT